MAVVYFSSPVKLEHGLYGFLGGQLNLWSRFSFSSYLSTGMHLCARKLTSTLNICPDQKVEDGAQWQEPWWYANHLFSGWRKSGGIGNWKLALARGCHGLQASPTAGKLLRRGQPGPKSWRHIFLLLLFLQSGERDLWELNNPLKLVGRKNL